MALLPPGDVLVAGPSAAIGPICAHGPAVQIGVAGTDAGTVGTRRLVRRTAHSSAFPPGVFAGCWSTATAASDAAALARLVRPGGVLAVEGAAPGTLASAGTPVPLSGTDVRMVTTPPADAGEPDCVFCPDLRFRLNRTAGLPGAAAIVAGDESFFLMPDLAPVADGHLLLVSTDHHLCAGALRPYGWARLERWLDRASRLYQEAYGTAEVLAFEHGPARPQGAGACVDHLHLHLLPGTPPVAAAIESTGLTGVPATARAVRDLHAAGRSYLLVGDTVYPVEAPRSQALRWAALTAVAPDAAPVWRWQQLFGLPGSRDRFLATLGALLPGADRLLSDRSFWPATSRAR